jgi:DNA-binding NarL/FixJ family response regulator
VYFDSKVSEILLCAFLTTRNSPRDLADPIRSLSNREREILQLVAEGKSNKDVALAMNISLKTVETHRTNLMAKLGLHSIGELVRYAFRNNIIGD